MSRILYSDGECFPKTTIMLIIVLFYRLYTLVKKLRWRDHSGSCQFNVQFVFLFPSLLLFFSFLFWWHKREEALMKVDIGKHVAALINGEMITLCFWSIDCVGFLLYTSRAIIKVLPHQFFWPVYWPLIVFMWFLCIPISSYFSWQKPKKNSCYFYHLTI